MVEFLTTIGVASAIETIIRKAETELVIISPYLKISEIFMERLQAADEKHVPITIVYGKNELEKDEAQKLEKLNNLKLLYYENLHAKCYYNEHHLVITSMNFHAFSQTNNREMGIRVTKTMGEDDTKIYDEGVQEAQDIIKQAQPSSIIKKRDLPKEKATQKPQKDRFEGFCIRCREPILLTQDRPFCHDCFTSWNRFQDPTYPESYCHRCGAYGETSMNRPFCYSCYKIIAK